MDKGRLLLTVLGFAVLLVIAGCPQTPKETRRIGVVLPLTGDIAAYGISSKQGMEVAVEDYSVDSLLGKSVQLVVEDEKGSPKDGVNAIRKLISIDKVPVVLGGISSSVALAMAPVAEQARTVLMCPFASSPQITTAGDYIFRIMPSDAFQASLLPTWLHELGYKKVAVLYVKNDWGESLKKAFVKDFEQAGGTVVFEESVPEGSRNVRDIVVKVKAAAKSADALFMPTYPEEAGLILKQLREMKVNVPIFGGDTWANDLLIQIGGPAVEGVKFLAPMQYEGPAYRRFAEKYRTKFAKEPDLPASAGYDAMRVILQCVVDISRQGRSLTGDELKNALYQVKAFPGATGLTTFDANGDVVSKAFSRRTILKGKIVDVTAK